MIDFNKIVNKLLKRWWNIILKEDIFEIIDPEKKPEYQAQVDKTIYRMKAEWIILSLKSGVYIIPDEHDKKMRGVDLIDKYYLKLLKRYITLFAWSHYCIGWKKSLQIHLKDFSLPEKIVIINRDTDKKIMIGDYTIVFKTIAWKIEKKKINLYSKLEPYIENTLLDGISFKVANLELSLLEWATISDNDGVDVALLNKAIKKYSTTLEKSIFVELARYKYIMSINRLKEISKPLNEELYHCFLDTIKQNGWLFIWEWLRGF
jgi:hypothetical protein